HRACPVHAVGLAVGTLLGTEAEAVVDAHAGEATDALAPERRVLALVMRRAGGRTEAVIAGAGALDQVGADPMGDAAAVRGGKDGLAAKHAVGRAGRIAAPEPDTDARALRWHGHLIALRARGLAHVRLVHAHGGARVADAAGRALAVLAAGGQ